MSLNNPHQEQVDTTEDSEQTKYFEECLETVRNNTFKALPIYAKASQDYPNQYFLLAKPLIELLTELGDFQKAQLILEELEHEMPNTSFLFNTQSSFYIRKKDWVNAECAIQNALVRSNNDTRQEILDSLNNHKEFLDKEEKKELEIIRKTMKEIFEL